MADQNRNIRKNANADIKLKDTAPPDKLGAVLQVYHQSVGDDAFQVMHHFHTLAKVSEQPYTRKLVATTEPMKLDFGWMKEVGFVLIRNLDGRSAQVRPTLEEIKARENRHLILGNEWTIPAGMFFLGCPKDASSLTIQSNEGEVQFTITGLPK